jgi:four helix bundle protein
LKYKGYKDLEIFHLSYKLAMDIHSKSLKLPKYELFEEGNQIRRSSKSIVANIVEGFGRRRYKNDFVKFLIYAQASCDETKIHLDFIFDNGHISEELHDKFYTGYDKLGKKIYKFINNIEKNDNSD